MLFTGISVNNDNKEIYLNISCVKSKKLLFFLFKLFSITFELRVRTVN